MAPSSGMNIAVVGAGISGVMSSYLLDRRHRVTLFEKNDYIGGHTNTAVIGDGADAGLPVDTGFIVHNERTYPFFRAFLRQLGVAAAPTDMSFSCQDDATGFHYSSLGFNGFFAQRANFFRPSYWAFLWGIQHFCRRTLKLFEQGKLGGLTLGEFARREGFRQDVIEQFVIPMASAIWSASEAKTMEFPMESFARFYSNHGLLSLWDPPAWYYIPGGSHTYVKAFLKVFKGKVVPKCPVAAVRRRDKGITLKLADGAEQDFDAVVIAAHADEAFRMLADPSPEETRLLGPWGYSQNHTVLHRDTSYLPENRRAWASWNYRHEPSIPKTFPATVTYYMNHLQRLGARDHYCVTLNPWKPVSASEIVSEMVYHHPMYTFESMSTQPELHSLN
ncbi:MAG TPA: FAD-dependent oxidoreductase, partial [Syntrophales bacterium]|nr:FAD-dependent oxidoreductase [Syntrophales bacterium]